MDMVIWMDKIFSNTHICLMKNKNKNKIGKQSADSLEGLDQGLEDKDLEKNSAKTLGKNSDHGIDGSDLNRHYSGKQVYGLKR